MADFTVYLLSTGQITQTYEGVENSDDVVFDGGTENFVSGLFDLVTEYIPGGTPTPRPAHNITTSAVSISLGGTVTFNNTQSGSIFEIVPEQIQTDNVYEVEEVTITDTSVAFIPDKIGEFQIHIIGIFPIQDFTTQLTVA